MVTQRTGRGSEIAVVAPTRCPKGHPLEPPNVQVFTARGSDGQTHVCWRCWTCEAIVRDDDVPPDTPQRRPTPDPDRSRRPR